MNENPIKKILILAANPKNSTPLRLDAEVRDIDEALKRSNYRDRFELEDKWAVRPKDLQREILDWKPQIVHFSGHGVGKGGLALEDETGQAKLVSTQAIAGLFKLFADRVECVLLNACYSEVQAVAIAQHITYVIGMKQAIGDDAARVFAVGFYDALGAGENIEFAFELACNRIDIEGMPDYLIPVLFKDGKVVSGSAAEPPEGSTGSSEERELIETTRVSDPRLLREVGDLGGLSNKLNEGQRRRLAREQAGLESQSNLLSEKLGRLRNAIAIETDAAIIFKLERQIEQAESEIKELELKLESIEEKINSNHEVLRSNTVKPTAENLNNEPIKPINLNDLDEPEELVGVNSCFYIERPPVEGRCYQSISRRGALIRIKAPRQMGKSSLMIRVLDRAKQQLGYQVVNLNFQSADESSFADLDTFLHWFCASIGQQLDLPENIDEYWNKKIFDSKRKCINFFQSYLLKTIGSPLVLALDNVDRVFHYPAIASDFFGLLRSWYEAARSEPIWENLRQIVVHSQEDYISLDIRQSPFNVGVGIELIAFDRLQIEELVAKHQLRLNNPELDELMALLGGHPYLVRVALYYLTCQFISLDKLLKTAPTDAGLFTEHLRRHLIYLKNKPELSAAMYQVVATENPVRLSDDLMFQLDSMGLILIQGNDVISRCNLYRLYFRDRLKP
jgi:AAA-like domain/CHAT domain